ncbi:AsnC family transcriptional regulator [Clostridium bovifaecis]|uniref:AsnC family transcriptional regulator n=1 Tax=Clostridium bovifaecis TaxID=2184719 RepID=A0A6I6EKL3_9CLOT|nr:AsnC family transcriptional regulator [Clostridium bovifaecis]
MSGENSKASPKYMLGSNDKQKWMEKYFFAPRGIGFLEPGAVPLDDSAMSAYNIAKSSYQIHPEVFNMDYLSKVLELDKDEIIKRMKRMYNDHLIMFVMNPATQVYGWGLYYWFVKLKKDTPKEVKDKLAEWYQNKDPICTGYECNGDFDFYNGDHMRVLDNLLYDVIGPWKENPEVEFVNICPIRRDVRESHVNMWDAPGDLYRENYWGEGQLEKLVQVQDKLDLTDLRIFKALNDKRPVEELFDFNVLSEISGLDPEDMKNGIKGIIEDKRILVPLFYLNFKKLNLTNRLFVIRLFQTIPCHRKTEIVDELIQIPELNSVMEFSDALYDIQVSAYNEITDIEALKAKLESYSEVEEIKEANVTRQFRRWVCRLDEENNYWEECVFTDDFLQNFAYNDAVNRCCRYGKEDK